MAVGNTNYPGSLDTTTNLPVASALSGVQMDGDGNDNKKHSNLHGVISESIVQLETKIGTGSSTASANAVLTGTGSGTSAWSATPAITGVGALNSGSITSGFGAIDVGSSAVTGGTFTAGTLVITDDQIQMTPTTDDTVTIAAAANGALNITTVDNAANAANLSVTVDGSITFDSVGNIELDAATGIWIFEDGGTEVLRITEGNSGDVTIKLVTNAKDLIFTDNGDTAGLTIKDDAAGIIVPGEVMTTKISFTDGDDAMTIADGGGVTFAQDITTTTHMDINFAENSSALWTDPIGDNTIDEHTAQGVIMTFKAGSTVTAFSPVYLHTDNEVHEARANAIATMPCIGVSINTTDVADGADIQVCLLGLVRDDTFAFGTAGAPVYVSETVGTMTNTAPTTTDAVVQIVGHSIGDDAIFVQPCLTTIEHA